MATTYIPMRGGILEACAFGLILTVVTHRIPAQECAPPVDFGFEAHSWTGGFAADCAIAVGPNAILATTNVGLSLFDRDGQQVSFKSLDDFFDAGTADTVCVYDRLSERYFVLSLVLGNGNLILAVSKTSDSDLDPENWHFYEWDPPDNADYPDLSVGPDHVFVGFARLGAPGGRSIIAYADKNDLVSGQQPTPASFLLDPIDGYINTPFRAIGSLQIYDETESIAYFVTDLRLDGQPSDKIRLYAVDPGEHTLVHHDLEVDPYHGPPLKVAVPNGGEVTVLWTIKSPVYRNGSAWIAHSIGPDDPQLEPKTAKARWYEIAMNGWPLTDEDPEVVQSGTIDPGAELSAFYPALHVDDEGNMAIAWNQCSANDHISIRRATRRYSDPLATLRAPLVLVQSTTSPGGSVQWADYSDMDEDADDPGAMWSHLMWFDGVETRLTWIARTDVNRSLTLDIEPQQYWLPRGTNVTLETRGAKPETNVRWYYSLMGCGTTYIRLLDVYLDIADAVFIAQDDADGEGTATKNFTIPSNFPLGPVWVQGAEYQNKSEVVEREIVEQ